MANTGQPSEIGHILSNSVEIVSSILTCMNAKQLNKCARVCQFWASLISRLKKRRHTLAWTCFVGDDGVERDALVTQTHNFFQALYSEPRLVFMFCSDLFVPVDNTMCTPPEQQVDFYQFVRTLLPAGCSLVALDSGGVVGTSSDLTETYEEEEEEQMCVSFLCLPHHDDDAIHCSLYHIGEISALTDGVCAALNDQVLLTFATDYTLTEYIRSPSIPDVLMAGGMVNNVVPVDRPLSEEEDMPVLLTVGLGGRCVRVASVVIKQNVRTPRKVEELIKTLKDAGLPETNSFAFMFACIGRGRGLYGEPKVESTIFHKLFPKTPLLGFFGNGEIGFKFVSKTSETVDGDQEKKRRKSAGKIHHAYTTIMVLVSLGY